MSLWWPNGRGEQVLYDVLLDVSVVQEDGQVQQVDQVQPFSTFKLFLY